MCVWCVFICTNPTDPMASGNSRQCYLATSVPHTIDKGLPKTWAVMIWFNIFWKHHSSWSYSWHLTYGTVGEFYSLLICPKKEYRCFGFNSCNWSVNYPYPEPVYTGWSSVYWNATGMPLADPVYTGIPLGHPANTCRVHWNTTGKT